MSVVDITTYLRFWNLCSLWQVAPSGSMVIFLGLRFTYEGRFSMSIDSHGFLYHFEANVEEWIQSQQPDFETSVYRLPVCVDSPVLT